jgi:predicted ATPase
MKIKRIHFLDVGPLGEQTLSMSDDWAGEIQSRILFSGPNGCGKSTVLRAVAMLWEAFGYWLDHQKALPKSHTAREWLQRWGGCAVVFEDAQLAPTDVGLFFGDLAWCEKTMAECPDVSWFGEGVARTGKPGNPKRDFVMRAKDWVSLWSNARKRMILGFDAVDIPNLVFLDAEERRWVSPRRNVGEHLAELPALRWLPKYLASDDWKGQLEASLINLKTTRLHKFHEVVRQLNRFLSGKEIETDIRPGENRLRVKIQNQRGQFHTLDELSAGEHQVLILIYMLARWAEKGCVVLIDEPDLYLHPSLVSGLLSSLEALVAELNGQLVITSHMPEVWRRYESEGKRIQLGGMA